MVSIVHIYYIMSEKIIKIRINLTGETKKMFESIKQKFNLNQNTEVIRLIIKLAYNNEFKNENKT